MVAWIPIATVIVLFAVWVVYVSEVNANAYVWYKARLLWCHLR
jgi:hypothetical protein